jgi:tetratricopeptide (TPR) repeat protein
MDFKITVPETLLNHPITNRKELQSVLTRTLILELNRQGCISPGVAAQAADMTQDEYDGLANSLKVPPAAYRTSIRDDFYPDETGPPARTGGRGTLVFMLVILIGLAASAVFYRGQLLTDYYTRQGLNHQIKGNENEALRAFLQAAKMNPNDATANIELEKIYIEKAQSESDAGRKSESEKDYVNALKYLAVAIAAAPNNPHVLYDAGYANEMLGDIETAKDYYRKALTADPGYTGAVIRLDNLESIKNNALKLKTMKPRSK